MTQTIHPSRRTTALFMLAMVGAPALSMHAADADLPPRAQWRASSSSVETPAMAAKFAIDGDEKTRWGGGFSPGHWFQLDLGVAAEVGGVLIRWDSGFAHAYRIEDSLDGTQWHTAFETDDATGGAESVFFPRVHARYLRLAAPARTADWGVSVFEFEPVSAHDAPQLRGLATHDDTQRLWSAKQSAAAAPIAMSRTLDIQLPRALPLAGLEAFWGEASRSLRLEARSADGRWRVLADDPQAPGEVSFLAAREPLTATALRLTAAPGAKPPSLRRLRLLGPDRVLTPMKRYEIAAARAHRELFPASLHTEQVYWTAVGIPAGRQKSVFDEYGDLEAFKGAPLVQPIWRDANGRSAAAFAAPLTHALRAGWMPLPSVRWSPQPGLELVSEAVALQQRGAPVTVLRHRLRNTGTQTIDGRLALVTRPMQMSPPWQNGGLSPIRDIAVENGAVRVNGRVLFESLTPPSEAGAAPFGAHGETEITGDVAAGRTPAAARAHDDDGLAAALLAYRVHLEPGAQQDIVVAFALGDVRIDASKAAALPAAPALDRAALFAGAADAGDAFTRRADEVAAEWQARVGRIGISLPDESLVDMLRAQAAYMLINQTGPALQPGPRNYNRSFIRDGSATAAVLARMGMAATARDYLRWYAAHAVHENGLVSPILNDDGSVNTGFGSDIEYDSQGQFVWLVAEIARLDGGAATVRDYRAKVRSALQFLQQLRERTLVPGYQAEREAPERFRGIIAPSISHEGYSVPTHSYWDDYWALKGWHDGIWLAEQWGDREMADWARTQYAALRESVGASIRATTRWKGSDTLPSSADLGDGDPTGVSIALDPCDQQDLLPQDALKTTYARYLDDVRRRDEPDALYAYTPYEMRNVLTYVHLERPDQAEELLTNLLRHRRPREWQVLAEVVYSDLRHAIYLGDMPHTWIGAEYARTIFGMLMHEGDERLHLLAGAPPSWVAGKGLAVADLPTSYGRLTMSAREENGELVVKLGEGLRAQTHVQVDWPNRRAPRHVTIDGAPVRDYDAQGIRIDTAFKELRAQW